MPSIHVLRWIENLKDTPLELYWFDVLNKGELKTIDKVEQFTSWKTRKVPYIIGEYFLNKKLPFLYQRIKPILEVTANEELNKIIQKIQPDVIHSFEMQNCSYPILKTMQKYSDIKWIYSCWGSDLFYYQNFKQHNSKIRQVLQRVNFLHTDCQRDYEIAKTLGFSGIYLDIIPGGTGYDLNVLEKYRKPLDERKIILIKGYQHNFGRGLNIIKALDEIQSNLQNYQVVVFGAHQTVADYINQNKLPYMVYDRHGLKHDELLELMGKSLVYIGNSISDGMPNTLLEAIVMGVFPIQSNPGGVTEEIIENNKNGLLIQNPENIEEIKTLLLQTINDNELLNFAYTYNKEVAKKRLNYVINQQKVIALYQGIKK